MTADGENETLEPITTSKDVVDRFLEKVDVSDHESCWEWGASCYPDGYGKLFVNGRYRPAHRVSYAINKQEPGDKFVLHKCDNKQCVNPDHLYAGTNSDNIDDAWERGQLTQEKLGDRNGEGNPNAKLCINEVKEIKSRFKCETNKSLAEEFGVSTTTISEIGNGNRWGGVSADE